MGKLESLASASGSMGIIAIGVGLTGWEGGVTVGSPPSEGLFDRELDGVVVMVVSAPEGTGNGWGGVADAAVGTGASECGWSLRLLNWDTRLLFLPPSSDERLAS